MAKITSLKRILASVAAGWVAVGIAAADAYAADLPTPKKHLFMASDMTRLTADVYAPATPGKHPAVVLLHQLGKSNADMLPLVAPLLKEGFIVVNLDMRGHGYSTGQASRKISFKQFATADWARLPGDLERVTKNVASIPNCDGTKMAIVGASIGANATVIAAKDDGRIKAIALLSPGLNFHELKPELAMASMTKPALIVAARDDRYSADSGQKLSKMDKNSSLDLIPEGGHGGEMLLRHPELNTQIAAWLHKAVQ